jgi:putative addiction module component (TIGR02574 family)
MKTKEMVAAISKLPVEERAKAVDEILQTFHRIDPDIEQAWAEEAERRLEEFKKGNAETIPGEQVHRQLRKKYSK